MVTKAIVTRSDSGVSELTQISHELIAEYAEKCQAEFIILCDNKDRHPHYRILELFELFDKFDRILSLDSDILIRKDCPDLFSFIPPNKIGTVLEDKGTRKEDRLERIKRVQEAWGDVGWQEGYPNTSVAMFSKDHKDIFKERELWLDWGYDDVYIGYHAKRLGFEFYELPYMFNHMRCFSEPWNGSPSRYDSYIIHYAGGGFEEPREQEIKKDYRTWKSLNLL